MGKGGEGGIELAQKVLETLEKKESHFHVLYEDTLSLKEKIAAVSKEIYGADGVVYSPAAEKQLKKLTELGFGGLPVCMAKPSTPFPITRIFWDGRKALKSM